MLLPGRSIDWRHAGTEGRGAFVNMRYLPFLLPVSNFALSKRVPIQHLIGRLVVLAKLLRIPEALLLKSI